MPIPDYQTCMLPLLLELNDGNEHALKDVEERLGNVFGLSGIERAQLLPSGQQAVFKNRVGWARTYMKNEPHRELWRLVSLS